MEATQGLQPGIHEQETIAATDSAALEWAQNPQWELKCSTELVLPMRRKLGGAVNDTAWEPGQLCEAGDKDAFAKAVWPCGWEGTLSVTRDYVSAIMRNMRGWECWS